MSEPDWLPATLAVLRGQIPDVPRGSGKAGLTHCGRQYAIVWNQRHRFGHADRLVCIRKPEHAGMHENRQGWRWSATRAPHQATSRSRRTS